VTKNDQGCSVNTGLNKIGDAAKSDASFCCDIQTSFAKTFRAWRRKNNLPLKRIASELGISLSTVDSIGDKWGGGDGRNRTLSSPTVSLNILIYKGILTLILQDFKGFLTLSATYRT